MAKRKYLAESEGKAGKVMPGGQMMAAAMAEAGLSKKKKKGKKRRYLAE